MPNINFNIMYHVNSAVIKSILRSMPRKEIPAEIEKIKERIDEVPPGNERTKYIKLLQFCYNLL